MHSLSILIKNKAKELGFDACGIAEVASADTEVLFFDRWIAEGCHAGMKYMENYRDIRLNPAGLVEGARSVISVALNYYPAQKQSPDSPRISYYAYGKDYHIVVKDKLRQLWEYITSLVPVLDSTLPVARFFTDSAPILERYWAWKAGLGWIGKNTNLIIPGKGSFFFLGEIVTTLELDYDTPQKNRCGTCRRCLDSCPTGALERPGHLNANKCISYLTIEHKGDIPSEQASRLGDRLYGCDTCQEVCPWNRFASPTREVAFSPSPAFLSLKKEDLRCFTRDDYNRIFAGSAVKRAKYEGLIRTINNKKE
ncbi:tRNA epoxyqueuosine(34) reductase QueG [Parabacteroides sp. BX2]|jgi:epoxyqueuosine reductase|uniref:Epoxyqueuosine reductase n=1 Tax=Parabacteroides segnis TaxID=2763058 RepID=A0ABR7DUR0_9BACT|nr:MULTISPECIES: tRNA epoxyqueuosine(34) reductase QueG [Parabacteroides]MBC5641281.1 tRNA epoxyqueuosine(34) reductase QueG [Parabacteroides segnis]MCM0715829.1 tRNA epoxyqueuosine(34) reductase QueG [Parabacteroides sp. TA-V-105]